MPGGGSFSEIRVERRRRRLPIPRGARSICLTTGALKARLKKGILPAEAKRGVFLRNRHASHQAPLLGFPIRTTARIIDLSSPPQRGW